MSWSFVCPEGWEVIQRWGDGYAVRQKRGGLRVLVDCEPKRDSKEWLHVSVSRANYTPTHDDMAVVKNAFIGEDRYAYSIWPPTDKYVNIHAHCLHLWACMEGDGQQLPEMSEVLEGIGRSI
jgi:hypothetical protein